MDRAICGDDHGRLALGERLAPIPFSSGSPQDWVREAVWVVKATAEELGEFFGSVLPQLNEVSDSSRQIG